MEIAKRREKTRHSGIPGFQQYCKSKSQININNNWKNIQQQTNQEQQQTTTEKTINIQQQQTISIQQQQQEKCIMNEESYEDVSYMLDSSECMVDG